MRDADRADPARTERWAMDHYRETIEAWKGAEDQLHRAEDAFTAEYGTREQQAQHLVVIDARSQVEILQREAALAALRILVGPSLADLINMAWGHAEMFAGRGPYEASTADEIREGRSDLASALFRSGEPA